MVIQRSCDQRSVSVQLPGCLPSLSKSNLLTLVGVHAITLCTFIRRLTGHRSHPGCNSLHRSDGELVNSRPRHLTLTSWSIFQARLRDPKGGMLSMSSTFMIFLRVGLQVQLEECPIVTNNPKITYVEKPLRSRTIMSMIHIPGSPILHLPQVRGILSSLILKSRISISPPCSALIGDSDILYYQSQEITKDS